MSLSSFSMPRQSFRGLLGLIAAALIFQMAAPNEEWARLLTIGLQGLVVIAALATAGADPRLMRLAKVAIALLFGISAITLIGIGGIGPAVPRLVSLLLVLLAPLAIGIGLRRELIEDRRVTLETVWGGLCLYLLLGLAFAFAFNLTEDLGGNAFFANGVEGTSNDFLYFSLATLTTTGYGDFTAATEFGRTLAVSEALCGQIYLVTIVALLVSNLGRPRPSGPVVGRLVADAGAQGVTEAEEQGAGAGEDPSASADPGSGS